MGENLVVKQESALNGIRTQTEKKKKLKKKTMGHEGIRTRVRNWKLIFGTPRFAELEVNLCTSH